MSAPRAGADRDAVAEAAGSDLPASRKWMITLTVMLITVMQMLDTSVTNVALPHMQGSLSAGVEEVAWVLTSYLAANAIIIPATGWLTGAASAAAGSSSSARRCSPVSVVPLRPGAQSGNPGPVRARFQGLGGGPVMPMSQAIMWEIFPLKPAGHSPWPCGASGIMMGADLRPHRWAAGSSTTGPGAGSSTSTSRSASSASCMAMVFLFDSPHPRRPGRVDVIGIVSHDHRLRRLQLMLDWGEREDWFDSSSSGPSRWWRCAPHGLRHPAS